MKIKYNFKLVLPLWSDSGLPTGMLWICEAKQKHCEGHLPFLYTVRKHFPPVGDFLSLLILTVMSITHVFGVWRDRCNGMTCSCVLSFAVKCITQKRSFSTYMKYFFITFTVIHYAYIYIDTHTYIHSHTLPTTGRGPLLGHTTSDLLSCDH